MEADIILADYATVDANNKYTLVGAGFTSIGASNFPCVHQSMFLLVRFQIGKNDVGKNRINVRLLGEKGHVFRAEGDIAVNAPQGDESFAAMSFHLQNTKFEVPGEYHVEVLINGEKKASQVLRVVQIANPIEPKESK